MVTLEYGVLFSMSNIAVDIHVHPGLKRQGRFKYLVELCNDVIPSQSDLSYDRG